MLSKSYSNGIQYNHISPFIRSQIIMDGQQYYCNRCRAAVGMHLNRKNRIGCSSDWLNCLNVLVLYCVQYN